MRVDLYTKIVLTIIAVCLVFLVYKASEPIPATATNEIVRVDLARIDGVSLLQSPYLYDRQDLELILGKIIGKTNTQKIQTISALSVPERGTTLLLQHMPEKSSK